MDRGQNAQPDGPDQHFEGLRFLKYLLKFLPPPVTGDSVGMAADEGALHLRQRGVGDLQTKPLLVAHRPQHAGRVVGETSWVQRSHSAISQAFQPAMGVYDLGGIPEKRKCHGIYREIPPGQVVFKGTGRNFGQRPGEGIYLFPGSNDIYPVAFNVYRGSAEPGVHRNLPTKFFGQV